MLAVGEAKVVVTDMPFPISSANPTISDASSLPPLLLTTQSLSSLHPLVYIVEQAGIFEGADPPPRVAAAQKQAIIETPSFRIVPEEEEEAARSSLGRPKRHVEEVSHFRAQYQLKC